MNTKDKYNNLVKEMYGCKSPCKQPIERMLIGRGDLSADVVFIGLAPNPNYHGIGPRVVFGPYSPTGKKVARLVDAIKLKVKKDVSFWFTNVIKCDSEKRDFRKNAIACAKYLEKEMLLIKPKITVLFGAKVIEYLLNEPMVHGKVSLWKDKYPCVHSYHPSPLSKLNSNAIEEVVEIVATHCLGEN